MKRVEYLIQLNDSLNLFIPHPLFSRHSIEASRVPLVPRRGFGSCRQVCLFVEAVVGLLVAHAGHVLRFAREDNARPDGCEPQDYA